MAKAKKLPWVSNKQLENLKYQLYTNLIAGKEAGSYEKVTDSTWAALQPGVDKILAATKPLHRTVSVASSHRLSNNYDYSFLLLDRGEEQLKEVLDVVSTAFVGLMEMGAFKDRHPHLAARNETSTFCYLDILPKGKLRAELIDPVGKMMTDQSLVVAERTFFGLAIDLAMGCGTVTYTMELDQRKVHLGLHNWASEDTNSLKNVELFMDVTLSGRRNKETFLQALVMILEDLPARALNYKAWSSKFDGWDRLKVGDPGVEEAYKTLQALAEAPTKYPDLVELLRGSKTKNRATLLLEASHKYNLVPLVLASPEAEGWDVKNLLEAFVKAVRGS